MSDQELVALADAAGLAPNWRDAFGRDHAVAPDTLRAVLAALDLPAGSDRQISDSLAALRAQQQGASFALVTALAGEKVALTLPDGPVQWATEDGQTIDAMLRDGAVTTPTRPGYHYLRTSDRELVVAVAPPRCLGVPDLVGDRLLWGLTLQLYALRRPGDGGIGDFTALREFVTAAARHGADAVGISPLHAQFSADPDRFSPYAPSSRVMLNALHIATDDPTDPLQAETLIDWPRASRRKLSQLRQRYDARGTDEQIMLTAWRASQGEALEAHARFEALHDQMFVAHRGAWHWRDWPAEYRDPTGPAVTRFARENPNDVGFHAWLQWQADQGLQSAQQAARAAGMKIGLIADLAVGTDGGGSHCWSRQSEVLLGLTVGAPPDLLSPYGQDWGLAAFSPLGLVRHGFRAFIEMLRASLRHAGGVRIDHAMGLARLWVVPAGADAAHGAYLHFPQTDLLRLLALESLRHRAIVLGEDLGTLPEGFAAALTEAGVMGLRVLWFERDGQFRPPAQWTRDAVAMTSTHDLPTVAGWWRGTDLDWRSRLHQIRDEAAERAGRDNDRPLLWHAFTESGAAAGPPPPIEDGAAVANAAAAHIGHAACRLALLPMEDALALHEQPNLPGTTDEHPNWRRRLPGLAGDLLEAPAASERLAALAAARKAH